MKTLSGWVKYIRRIKNKTFIVLSKQFEEFQIIDVNNLTDKINIGTYLVVKVKEKFFNNKLDLVLNEIIFVSYSDGNEATLKNLSLLSLKERHIFFRNIKNRNILKQRENLYYLIRKYYKYYKFLEINTPILALHTEEGAKSFHTKSEISNRYYSLPQSPQIYKQICMYSGFEKYFQIAEVFRDEPTRKDRLFGAFTQLDVEFAPVFSVFELVLQSCRALKYILTANKSKVFKNFVIFKYKDCIKKYQSDKPNIEDTLVCIVDFPMFEEGTDNIKHNPFTKFNSKTGISEQFDLVWEGYEILSGGLRTTDWDSFLQTYSRQENKEHIVKKYGFFKKLWSSGIPPHGGYAFGLDRIIAITLNLETIEDSVFFPCNKSGRYELIEEND